MSFTNAQKVKILGLKGQIASYYSLQMKKLGDRKLESLFFENCIITGGCISSIAHGIAVADIDLYAKTKEGLDKIYNYMLNEMNQNQIKTYDKYDFDADGNKLITVKNNKLITDNAITLTNDVQFVHLGNADDCRNNFDMIHCMSWYDLASQKFYISKDQWFCISNKIIKRNPFFLKDIPEKRIAKYAARGWH